MALNLTINDEEGKQYLSCWAVVWAGRCAVPNELPDVLQGGIAMEQLTALGAGSRQTKLRCHCLPPLPPSPPPQQQQQQQEVTASLSSHEAQTGR